MTQTKSRRPRCTYSNEFKNQIIDKILDVFEIERSLSIKWYPYDSAVAESTYKVVKTLEQLSYELADYVNGSPGSAKYHP